jgi:hypothetical protein
MLFAQYALPSFLTFVLDAMCWVEEIISSNQNILEGMLELSPATTPPQPKLHSHRSGDDVVKGSA